jgi:hypothetical protein
VRGDQLTLARKVWRAFGAAEPTGLNRFAQMHYPALPYLQPALVRLLEHFPATGDGLTRTERQVLTALAGGAQTPADLFALDRAAEPAPFLGDLVFWHVLASLASGDSPLIAPLHGAMPPPADPRFTERPVRLTALGRATLAGQADRIAQGRIDRWLGGVHLRGRSIGWRWDRARSMVVAV